MSRTVTRAAAVLMGTACIVCIPLRAEAQITRRLKDAVKQGVEDRKQRTEDHLLEQTALTADSAASVALTPVDRAVAGAAAGVESAIAYVVGGAGSDGNATEVMTEGLDQGRLDLAGVFDPGTAEITGERARTLGQLADILYARGGSYLLEGRVTWDEEPGLGKERAVAAKAELAAAGVDESQLFATAGGEAGYADVGTEEGVPITLTVRPLD